MHSTRFTQLLLTALGLVSAAQASGIRYNARGLMVRQDDGDDSIIPTILPGTPGDGSDGDDGDDGDDGGQTTPTQVPGSDPSTSAAPPPPTTSAADPPTSTPDDNTPTSTPEDVPPTTSTPPEPSTSSENDPPPTTSSENTEPSSTTPPDDEPTSSSANNNDESSTTRRPVVSTAIETVTRTNSDGSETTVTSSTLTTSTDPATQDGSNSGSGGGLDANTRNIVIGVVVGVGGAILLGALGVVAWRIRNRKKAAEENDGLMGDYGEYNSGYGAPMSMDKSEPPSSAAGTTSAAGTAGTGRSPFQSNLESYHQPTQPVNASSNF